MFNLIFESRIMKITVLIYRSASYTYAKNREHLLSDEHVRVTYSAHEGSSEAPTPFLLPFLFISGLYARKISRIEILARNSRQNKSLRGVHLDTDNGASGFIRISQLQRR